MISGTVSTYQLVVEVLNHSVRSLLRLELYLGDRDRMRLEDSALVDQAAHRNHCALNIGSRRARSKILRHHNVWAGKSSYRHASSHWWCYGCLRCQLLKSSTPSVSSRACIVVPVTIEQVHLRCDGRVVLRSQQGILLGFETALGPGSCGGGRWSCARGVDARCKATGSRGCR